MEYQATKAILVGICTEDGAISEVEKGLDELERLLDTAGGECLAKLIQNKDRPDPRTLIGSGKVLELAALCQVSPEEAARVVFDLQKYRLGDHFDKFLEQRGKNKKNLDYFVKK